MDRKNELVLAEMRKSSEKLTGSSIEMYGDPTLMRFLIARSMDIDKASKMFVEWMKWRQQFVPLNYIPETEIQHELGGEKAYLQGLSKKTGNSVIIVKANKHFPAKDQLQFKRFVVYFLDKTVASACRGKEIGNEQLIGIVDLQQLGYKNVDARGFITGFQFLQAYYPQRLAKLYLLHMPWFFVSVWRLISRFLEKDTLDKIVIVTNEEERREFIEHIGEETLPEEYGGQAKPVLVQDFVLTTSSDNDR